MKDSRDVGGGYRSIIPSKKLRVAIDVKQDRLGTTIPVYAMREVPCNHTRFFNTNFKGLFAISKSAMNFLLWLCKDLPASNMVCNTEVIRQEFIDFTYYVSDGELQYNHRHVTSAFSALLEAGILLRRHNEKGKIRGQYIVNPEMFVRNNNEKRFDLIKENLKYLNKKYTKEIIDEK